MKKIGIEEDCVSPISLKNQLSDVFDHGRRLWTRNCIFQDIYFLS